MKIGMILPLAEDESGSAPSWERLKAAARQTILDGYDLHSQSLPRLIEWVESFGPKV